MNRNVLDFAFKKIEFFHMIPGISWTPTVFDDKVTVIGSVHTKLLVDRIPILSYVCLCYLYR